QRARLGLGGGDPAVLEQLAGQVRQDQPLVRRASAEAGALLRSRHVLSRFSPAVSGTGVDGFLLQTSVLNFSRSLRGSATAHLAVARRTSASLLGPLSTARPRRRRHRRRRR